MTVLASIVLGLLALAVVSLLVLILELGAVGLLLVS